MLRSDPAFKTSSSAADAVTHLSDPTVPQAPEASSGWDTLDRNDQPLQPWSWSGRRRSSAHLSTGLRSPLSWLIYALLVAIVAAWLRPYWREALLAFACTALLGAFWILIGNRHRPPPDDEALMARIDAMAGLEFEVWIVERLVAAGYQVRNVRASGDFGVDIITWIHGLAVGLQPKRYQGKVGNDAVQQVLAGCDYHGCHLAVVLTQSSFTAAAREQAEKARHPVVLIERTQLLDLVDILDVAAADPGIRRRILRRRSLAVYGMDRLDLLPEAQSAPPALPTPADGSGQEAAEDLIAHRYALGAEAQRGG